MERTYRIRMAAEMTGVSEGLIRAWERRHGVLNPRRSASGYRSYTAADIEVLRRLKKLTEEGVAIADAVRLLPRIKREAKAYVGTFDAAHKPPLAHQYARWLDDALAAAEQMDQQAIEEILDEAMGSVPPMTFFEEVIVPLQQTVGDRWHEGRLTVAEEHLVTQAVRQRLLALLHRAPRRARQHVVCACFPLEDHELGLMGVALRFRHAGWRVTFLGARTPVEHLARVVLTVEPQVVALSAVAAEPEVVRQTLDAVRAALPPGMPVVVGGPAALAARDVVGSLGGRLVESAEDWAQLLG